MDDRNLPQTSDNKNEDNVAQEYKIEARDVHNAFVDLISYYQARDFGNLMENADLYDKEDTINSFFSLQVEEYITTLLPYARSTDALHRISDSNNSSSTKAAREAISSIGGIINSLVLPTDSCGLSANETANIFLGKAGKELIPNKTNMLNFNKLVGEKEENTILAEVISYDSPVLIRIEIKRSQPSNNSEITCHSYCVFVAEEKNEFGGGGGSSIHLSY